MLFNQIKDFLVRHIYKKQFMVVFLIFLINKLRVNKSVSNSLLKKDFHKELSKCVFLQQDRF